MPTRKLIAISVIIAVAVIGFAIKTMTNSDTLLIQGEVEATRIDLTPRVSGRVSEVLVDFGDKVEKAQVVVRLLELLLRPADSMAPTSLPTPGRRFRPTH